MISGPIELVYKRMLVHLGPVLQFLTFDATLVAKKYMEMFSVSLRG